MNAKRPDAMRLATVLNLSFACAFGFALAACSKPTPPDKEQPPEPRATQLRDAIQAPINKAKAVEPEVLEAAKQQAADIDAQTSGETPSQPAPGN